MKRKTVILYALLAILVVSSCRHTRDTSRVPFYGKKGNKAGDSIFVDHLLQKIIFTDTTIVIDSFVYERFDNSVLKSVSTYHLGKKVFETIEYRDNGLLSRYLFSDEDCKDCFYERIYDSNGKILRRNGKLFFQCYITNIDTKTLEIKKGEPIDYSIFYPNPPDCNTKVVIRNDDGDYEVFHKNKFLNFLQTARMDTDHPDTTGKHPWSKANICIDLKDPLDDSTSSSCKALFFKII